MDLRKCIGSTKFGIEAHEAPPEDFPAQPSQRDGLGRMCKPHWTEYTRALRRNAPSALRPVGTGPGPQTHRKPEPIRTKARETPAVAPRRAKIDAMLAEVGVESDEGQQILEDAGAAAARALRSNDEEHRTIDQVDAWLDAGDIAEGEGA